MTNPEKSLLLRFFESSNRILIALLLLAFLAITVLVMLEAQTSWLQSREIYGYATSLDYDLGSGASQAIHFPKHGPFDRRMGYTHLPAFSERLQARNFVVQKQVRFSAPLMKFTSLGYFAPYNEKTRAGLHIGDTLNQPVYNVQYPLRAYEGFDRIPTVIVNSLLFIENRVLLDLERPNLNPAVDWPRFARAVFAQVARKINEDIDSPGGSTLATQIEKYRHSPDGLTYSPTEKIRQMVSASVRAYSHGMESLQVRRALVVDYLNTVPLSAAPVYGEVHGLGDGLWVWYGADFDQVNRLLADEPGEGQYLKAQGLALRQALSLIIANRRPTYYLGNGNEDLSQLTDSHLRILGKAGVISPSLERAALESELRLRDAKTEPARPMVDADKGSKLIRARLAGLLNISLYDLDRLDLDVSSTLDQNLQQSVSHFLHQLSDPQVARESGLFGERLLAPDTLEPVRYSFTLFERTAGGNRVRVQTDTTDQPLDINEGSKLELGSTAKLRVLATYLGFVAELHDRYADLPTAQLRSIVVDRQDTLTRWAIDYLVRNWDRNLTDMLEAALDRSYSASPNESFFTGGGLHTFQNFRREDNGRIPSLRTALQESINLPFVRLMRDLVRHAMYRVPGSTAKLLEDNNDPRREEYLARFADREGQVFLRRFWRKYQGLVPVEIQATLLDGLRPTVDRLSAAYRYLNPNANQHEFSAFILDRFPENTLSDAHLGILYRRYAPGSFNLPDQGYITRIHPLELWLARYLSANPGASLESAVEASQKERQEVYRWLFRTRFKNAQDRRISTLLEIEAFLDIHRRWARLGYPFKNLVPSYATALGSSGDRPAALAELMGIIMNDGVRLPTIRINSLHFAANTPYETVFQQRLSDGEQVMAPQVARALRAALSEVVEGGTARRLAGAFKSADGNPLAVGGKTGTGDNRIVTVSPGGQKRSTSVLNRTATFVFYLGERHFGTLTAYVSGQNASQYHFTSGLPVQILKSMSPLLLPYLVDNDNP